MPNDHSESFRGVRLCPQGEGVMNPESSRANVLDVAGFRIAAFAASGMTMAK
jgi:hypothetical protein